MDDLNLKKIQDAAALNSTDFAAIAHAYSYPKRYYHTLEHALDVASRVLEYNAWTDREAAVLAALYHDAVYIAGDPNNEFLSASLLHKQVKDASPFTRFRAEKFIVLTAHHFQLERMELSEEDCVFLDCDLASCFAGPYDKFLQTQKNIDKEFLPLFNNDLALTQKKRRSFLQSVYDKNMIFLSKMGKDRYEAAARENLQRVLYG